ncbi:MAG: hypothetical protein ACRCTB_00850 [Vibrio sp.]
MRRTITLAAGSEYAFDIGRNALILVIRNATANVVFRGDSLTPIELSRSDIVHVNDFRNKRMFFSNETDKSITVEFQLSDVPISIREQRVNVDNAITVGSIVDPVEVTEILAPVSISGVVPVSLDGGVAVSNFPEVQPVSIVGGFSAEPQTQVISRKMSSGVIAIPDGWRITHFSVQHLTESTTSEVSVMGFKLEKGGYYELNHALPVGYELRIGELGRPSAICQVLVILTEVLNASESA